MSESRPATGPYAHLHILCSLTGIDFSLLVEKETVYRLLSVIAHFLQLFLGLKVTTIITENTHKVINCAKLHLFQYVYCGQALD